MVLYDKREKINEIPAKGEKIMLDSVDKKILSCLSANARMNASSIGAEINMSVSAVIERIKKLESSGVIQKYTIVTDPSKLGRDVLAFVEVGTDNMKQADVTDPVQAFAASHDEVIECHIVTGSSDFLLKVCIDSTRALQELLQELKGVQGVTTTKTSVVMSTTKSDYLGMTFV